MRLLACFFISLIAIQALAYTPNDPAKTILTDGTYSDTTNAIAYVTAKAQDGWVMTVGSASGSATWNGPVNINIGHTFTMMGGHTKDCVTNSIESQYGLSTVTVGRYSAAFDGFSVTPTYTGGFQFNVTCTPEHPFTLAYFDFPEFSAGNALGIFAGSGTNNFRVTQCHFHHTGGISIFWVASGNAGDNGNGPYGLADHCYLDSTAGGSGYALFYVHANISSAGSTAWNRYSDGNGQGTAARVYVEYCLFAASTAIAGRPMIDGAYGAQFAVRNNVLSNFDISNHGADESIDLTNSALAMEIMHNKFLINGNQAFDAAIQNRGGCAWVYSNSFERVSGPSFVPDYGSLLKDVFYRGIPGTDGLIPQDRFYPGDYIGTMQPGYGIVAAAGQDPHFLTYPWGSVIQNVYSNTVGPGTTINAVVGTASGDPGWIANGRDYTNAVISVAEFTNPHPLDISLSTDPAIVVEPSNQTVISPSPATFSVNATGLSALSYQWSKNGSQISGATQATYTTPATSYPSDNGSTFYVVVTDLAGSIQSGTVTLTVTPNPGASLTVNGINANVGSFKSAY